MGTGGFWGVVGILILILVVLFVCILPAGVIAVEKYHETIGKSLKTDNEKADEVCEKIRLRTPSYQDGVRASIWNTNSFDLKFEMVRLNTSDGQIEVKGGIDARTYVTFRTSRLGGFRVFDQVESLYIGEVYDLDNGVYYPCKMLIYPE